MAGASPQHLLQSNLASMVAPPPAPFAQREPFSESEEGPDEHLLSSDVLLDTLVPAPLAERS
eukprot:8394096-Alexandrium_andersonii.AAC.1